LLEQELIERARQGDHHAFTELVRQYEPRIAATVYGMLGSCAEAEDVGQETFIRFYKSLNAFRGQSSVGTYLTRIAINLSLNELKRRRRRRQRTIYDSVDELKNLPDTGEAAPPLELRELVQMALQGLPPKFRTVLVLRLIDGYSTRETAEILNLPEGTVLSRLARAQKKIQAILAPYYGENNGQKAA